MILKHATVVIRIDFLLFLLLTFFSSSITAQEELVSPLVEKYPALSFDDPITQDVNRIYDQVKRTLNSPTAFPEIEIRERKKSVASFNFSRGVIIIEKKAYEICDGMGSANKSAALAFLIGHELFHFLKDSTHNHEGHETGLLLTIKELESKQEFEQMADEYGAFFTYLAGFDLAATLPLFLDQVYTEYLFNQTILDDYPPLEIRKKAFESVCEKAEIYANVFKTGTYLAALGENWQAANCFEFLLQDFKFPEFYNNVGLCKFAAYLALPTASNYTNFVYPIDLDLDSPIRRGGTADETRSDLLSQAVHNLSMAIKMNPNYFAAQINLLSAKIASDDFENAERLLQNLYLQFPSTCHQAKVKMAEGILRSRQENNSLASKLFKEAKRSCKSESIKASVKWNLNVLKGKDNGSILFKDFNHCSPLDGIDLNFRPNLTFDTELVLKTDEELMQYWNMLKLKNSTIIQYQATSSSNQSMHLLIQKSIAKAECSNLRKGETVHFQAGMDAAQITKLFSHLRSPKTISGSLGYFFVYHDHPLILQFDNKNKLLEWAFYGLY